MFAMKLSLVCDEATDTTVLHWPDQLTSGQWLDLIQTWLPAQHKIAQAMLIGKIIHNIDMHISQVVGVGEHGIQCNVAILTLTDWCYILCCCLHNSQLLYYYCVCKLQCRYRYLPRTTLPEYYESNNIWKRPMITYSQKSIRCPNRSYWV